MGQQHHSHIVNNCSNTIKVVLVDNKTWQTSQIIESNDYVAIPTPHGRIHVSVFRKVDGKFNPNAEAQYADDSDRSFIVKEVDGFLQIVRSKYGHIWEEEKGLRK